MGHYNIEQKDNGTSALTMILFPEIFILQRILSPNKTELFRHRESRDKYEDKLLNKQFCLTNPIYWKWKIGKTFCNCDNTFAFIIHIFVKSKLLSGLLTNTLGFISRVPDYL